MRVMLKVTIPVEAGNAATKAGKLGETIQSILDELNPEAVYLTDSSGQRAAYIFMDLREGSDIAKIAEPWFLALNASIELHPVMVPADLAKAGPKIEEAVKKYG